jgi:hypothetical protein
LTGGFAELQLVAAVCAGPFDVREPLGLGRHLEQGVGKTELAKRFGISRRTAYHWIETGQLDRDLDSQEVRYRPRPPVRPRSWIRTRRSSRHAPTYPLLVLTACPSPVNGAAADLQLANFLAATVDLESERGPCLRQLKILERGLCGRPLTGRFFDLGGRNAQY